MKSLPPMAWNFVRALALAGVGAGFGIMTASLLAGPLTGLWSKFPTAQQVGSTYALVYFIVGSLGVGALSVAGFLKPSSVALGTGLVLPVIVALAAGLRAGHLWAKLVPALVFGAVGAWNSYRWKVKEASVLERISADERSELWQAAVSTAQEALAAAAQAASAAEAAQAETLEAEAASRLRINVDQDLLKDLLAQPAAPARKKEAPVPAPSAPKPQGLWPSARQERAAPLAAPLIIIDRDRCEQAIRTRYQRTGYEVIRTIWNLAVSEADLKQQCILAVPEDGLCLVVIPTLPQERVKAGVQAAYEAAQARFKAMNGRLTGYKLKDGADPRYKLSGALTRWAWSKSEYRDQLMNGAVGAMALLDEKWAFREFQAEVAAAGGTVDIGEDQFQVAKDTVVVVAFGMIEFTVPLARLVARRVFEGLSKEWLHLQAKLLVPGSAQDPAAALPRA